MRYYDKICLPEIPDEYISKFPRIKEMVDKIKSNKDYICKVVDCSLGGKYPVAGLIVIKKNTGKFGFKLGAHPDYGIAMERCFTEAAQGMDIYDYATGCLFDFKNEDIFKDENVREFVNSNVATIPYEVFGKKSDYEFTEIKDVSDLNNKEILNQLVTNIINEGYDILIRDVSYLGFPSYRIIISGMTEITHSKMAGRFNMFEEIEYLLKDFNRINLKNIDKVIEIMEKQIYEVGFSSLYTFLNVKDFRILPCENIGYGAKYFLALCYIMNKQYDKAEEILEEIIYIAESLIPDKLKVILIKAVYYYASAMNKIENHEKVIYYINMLFDESVTTLIDDNFKDREKILLKNYNIKPEDYVENDDDYYLPFMKTLKEVQKENNIDQMKLETLFD